ncbi:MAG: TIGR03620 family F420-dependent LLM class oxidoreductase [Alphaproteobacteria bacterium]|jgi:probable F420-dependent oxidoreductase|nr:TIGR03620 family F420-dependent LLM class oxidoreductase [Alphaproteobacteria bacterium]
MQVGAWGVWFSTNGLRPPVLARLAETVEQRGYSVLWYPEALAYESMALAGYLLGCTERLMVGSGIANIYARDATAAMQGHHTLNALYDGRFILGLGVSHIPIVQTARGHTYGKPLAAMRAYLEAMYAAPIQTEAPPRQVVLAALGPRMLALAAELADGALPYNVTPEHTVRAREILGPDKLLCVEQKICLTADPDRARRVAAQQLARYMVLPNYRNCWLSLGFNEDDLAGEGSARFLDAMIAWGSEDDIRRRLQEHVEAGADHVAIQPFDPEGGPLPDWRALDAFAP